MRRLGWFLVTAAVLAGCFGGETGGESDDQARESRACKLLSTDEVASFVGERVYDGRPDQPGEGVTDTCRWGDADPAAPGHVLSIRLAPAGSVEDEADPGDQSYELVDLGEGAVGYQQAGGGVRVVFTVEAVRATLTYDVVPVDRLESDAIDRLARLAGRVRDRLLDAPPPNVSSTGPQRSGS